MSTSQPSKATRTSAQNRCAEAIAWCEAVAKCPPGACALVGGAVRDLLRGDEPKDWDVYFFGMSQREIKRAFASIDSTRPTPYARHKNLMAQAEAPFGHVQVMYADGAKEAADIVAKCD